MIYFLSLEIIMHEMISVLIPVYNYDISFLVDCLHQAVTDSESVAEIIIGADGCDSGFLKSYKDLEKLEGVSLLVSNTNIGRAAIRNRLAEKASGNHLLYIDADALIQGNALPFIQNYLDHLDEAPVLCGGTAYRSVRPDDPDRYLRWNYGVHREQRSARKRNKNPYSSFSGFNFMVDKSVFLKLRFNEELHKYGHEDTLFGYQLKIVGKKILHIDNSLIHEGIETNREFILKTQEGVQNLSLLYDMVTDKGNFIKSVRLLRLYHYLRLTGIAYPLTWFYKKYRRRIEIYLRRRKSTLLIFSIYKLALFCFFRSSTGSSHPQST